MVSEIVRTPEAMPELPEVETTRRGLEPHILGKRITGVVLRRDSLRWPIPYEIVERLPGEKILAIERRAKYLLMHTAAGSALWHLGMSGSMRVLKAGTPTGKHDHVDIELTGKRIIRFTDPRRFDCLLWQPAGEIHPLLRKLGPEPLSPEFTGEYLYHKSRGKTAAVKSFLMDQAVVVGVGNIYAAESLFRAGISPLRKPAVCPRRAMKNWRPRPKKFLLMPLSAAVLRCAISSIPIPNPVTSNRNWMCTAVRASPASDAVGCCASSA